MKKEKKMQKHSCLQTARGQRRRINETEQSDPELMEQNGNFMSIICMHVVCRRGKSDFLHNMPTPRFILHACQNLLSISITPD